MPYQINGTPAPLSDPKNVDGITFVPGAAVAEALGGVVEWKHDAKAASIELGGKTAFVYLNNSNAVVDGASVDLGGQPFLENDILWVPARLFRDGFGAQLIVEGDSVTLAL